MSITSLGKQWRIALKNSYESVVKLILKASITETILVSIYEDACSSLFFLCFSICNVQTTKNTKIITIYK